MRFAAGLVPTSQLARHYESAGQQFEAARQFLASAQEMLAVGSTNEQAAALLRSIACFEKCTEDAETQKLEVQARAELLVT